MYAGARSLRQQKVEEERSDEGQPPQILVFGDET